MDINKYLEGVRTIIGNLDAIDLAKLVDHLQLAYETEKTIFVIGNGGSAANASHFAQDLSKGIFFNKPVAKTMKALSLTDNIAHITAIANDDGFEKIFSAQLYAFSKAGDFLVCISGSGNSKNILEAVAVAKQKNMFVIGVTGFDGGELLKQADFSILVPINDMCTIESIHSVIFHLIVLELRERLAGQVFNGL